MICRAKWVTSLCYLSLLATGTGNSETDSACSITSICIVKDSNSPKPIAPSAKTYLELIKDGNIFIDKSLLIEAVLKDENEVIFIHRPFGWGKTVNMDMIKRFVQLETNPKTNATIPHTETRSYRLFKKGELPVSQDRTCKLTKPPLISEHEDLIRDHLAQYPVIHLSFGNLKPNKYNEFAEGVGSRFEEALRIYDFQSMINRIPRTKIFASEELEDMVKLAFHGWHDLSYLCAMLNATYARKPFILIDDYDEPLLYALTAPLRKKNTTIERIVKSYISLFHELDKPERFYERVVFAGTTRWSWDEVLPNMNSSRCNRFHGFKRNEVREIGKYLGLPEQLIGEAATYYGGYEISDGEDACNPLSMAKFLANNKTDVGWATHEVFDTVFDKIVRIGDLRYQMTALCIDKKHRRDRSTTEDYINDSSFIELATYIDRPSSPGATESVKGVAKDLLRATGYLSNSYKIPNTQVRTTVENKLFSIYATNLGFTAEDPSKSTLSTIGEKLKLFLDTNDTTSEALEANLLDFFRQLTIFGSSRPTNDLNFANKRPILDVLHFISLYTAPDEILNSDGDFHAENRSFGFIVTRVLNRGCVIVMSYGDGSVEKTLNATKARAYHSFLAAKRPGIDLVKRVAIHYSSTGKVFVLGRTEAVDKTSNDTLIS